MEYNNYFSILLILKYKEKFLLYYVLCAYSFKLNNMREKLLENSDFF